MPVDQPPLVSGAGARPFRTRDDVIAQLDELTAAGDVAPVRDALLDALTALLYQLQYRGEYAVAQADLLRTTEGYLTSLGGDDRGIPRAPDESDEDYRARLLATPETVTERAIVTGVNVILAAFTSTEAQLVDAVLDRWFLGDTDSTRVWHSFLDAAPEYPDRLFSGQEPSNDGYSRPNSDPGGARVFDETMGRHFMLVLPDLSGLPEPSCLSDSGTIAGVSEAALGLGFYCGNTSTPDVLAVPGSDSLAVLSIYRSVESFVNTVVGQSIRWSFIAELEAA